MFKVRVQSKLAIFILLAHIAIFVGNNSFMQVNPQKKMFAFIIFNPDLYMLLPSKMMAFSDDISLMAWAWAWHP